MVDKELTPDRARKGHELFRFRHATRERLLHKNVLTGVERLFRQCKVRTNRRRDGDEVDLGITNHNVVVRGHTDRWIHARHAGEALGTRIAYQLHPRLIGR